MTATCKRAKSALFVIRSLSTYSKGFQFIAERFKNFFVAWHAMERDFTQVSSSDPGRSESFVCDYAKVGAEAFCSSSP